MSTVPTPLTRLSTTFWILAITFIGLYVGTVLHVFAALMVDIAHHGDITISNCWPLIAESLRSQMLYLLVTPIYLASTWFVGRSTKTIAPSDYEQSHHRANIWAMKWIAVSSVAYDVYDAITRAS